MALSVARRHSFVSCSVRRHTLGKIHLLCITHPAPAAAEKSYRPSSGRSPLALPAAPELGKSQDNSFRQITCQYQNFPQANCCLKLPSINPLSPKIQHSFSTGNRPLTIARCEALSSHRRSHSGASTPAQKPTQIPPATTRTPQAQKSTTSRRLSEKKTLHFTNRQHGRRGATEQNRT